MVLINLPKSIKLSSQIQSSSILPFPSFSAALKNLVDLDTSPKSKQNISNQPFFSFPIYFFNVM
jgi:hypothetical protein